MNSHQELRAPASSQADWLRIIKRASLTSEVLLLRVVRHMALALNAPSSAFPCLVRRRRRAACHEEAEDGLHQPPAAGAGEGVPLQPLPVSPAQAGDGCWAEAHRSPGQDLVSEPQDEVQEGAQGHKGGRCIPVVCRRALLQTGLMRGPDEFPVCR